MKKSISIFLASALTIGMITSMVGCGDSTGNNKETVATTLEGTETATGEEIDEEVEQKPSEQPDDTDVIEETPENNIDTPEETPEVETEQQDTEPAENDKENQAEDTQEELAVLPSEDIILSLAELVCTEWGTGGTRNNSGQVFLNTNQAVEMATSIAFWYSDSGTFESYHPDGEDGDTYIIPAATVQDYMTTLFGSQFQLSDFSNPESYYAFETSIPGYTAECNGHVSRNNNGDFEIYIVVGANTETGRDISVESITPSGPNACEAIISFIVDVNALGDFDTPTIGLGLVEDPTAKYGWAITSVQFEGSANRFM